jgi:type II secretory pathway component PulF
MNWGPTVQSDPVAAIAEVALHFLLYLVVGLLPACGFVYLNYYFLTLPMRRNEQARVFLDLLEVGLKTGRTPEQTILDASATQDPAMGPRVPLLAAHFEKGVRLGDALVMVPRLLAPQVTAMLRSGERIGDLAKVLPACRQFLNDSVSQVRGALNYLLILAFVLTPFTVAVPIMINVLILPKFKEVFAGFAPEAGLPEPARFVFAHSRLLLSFQVAIILLIWTLMAAYIGGPRLRGWVARILPGVPDRIQYCFPWRRKRLQRDFSSMLCVLLDSGVPELEAIALAAESTKNGVVRRRAQTVCRLLNDGVKLSTAIGAMDESGELQWRLRNALQRGGGFLRALAGWHEALDAKAFQSEQAAAQLTTSALVLFNGLIVASVVIAVFGTLVHLINYVALW